MAKSGKGQSAGAADAKSAAKVAAKELGRLEKRLLKARDVEAKRKKQASEARAEVAQLTAQIKELKPAPSARPVRTPASRAASPARSRVRAKPAGAKQAAAKTAAAKPAVAVASTRTKPTARTSTASTSTRRKTASAPATRTARTKTVPADGSGDGTGPS